MERRRSNIAGAIVLVFVFTFGAYAQSTGFTYQGRLLDAGLPPTGNYDFEFRLFDSLVSGTQQGATLTVSGVSVTNGIFTVRLDFGAQFPGVARFLQIAVRPAGGGAFTTLAPRQPITSAPYAVKSLNADSATTATSADSLSGACVGCVTASQIGSVNGSAVTGEIPVASVPAGSGSYIQNTTSPQASSNFNISGTGTASIFNAATQYNIGGNHVLSNAGTENLFAGVGAGASNTTGSDNAFFGRSAGQANTTGVNNAFFGTSAGFSNTTGGNNAFFGRSAGQANTIGVNNAFFGTSAGFSNTTSNNNAFFGTFAGNSNTTGGSNAFFGTSAGFSNTTGVNNAFFGRSAGQANTIGVNNAFFGTFAGNSNTTGGSNAFFGSAAGFSNTTGNFNAFFGRNAGFSNTTGSNNTIIGDAADVGAGNLTFATAIGAGAVVTVSNRVQLGRNGFDTVSIGALAAATATDLCINSDNVLAACSSSGRYKKNITNLNFGLNLVKQLRPVRFEWAERGEADLGLIAEEVAAVDPLLATYNEKGEIQGVKYKQLSVVLINAIKEQQAQIERQQKQIEELKRLVCAQNPTAEICKEEK